MHHSSLDNFNENNDITTTWTTTTKKENNKYNKYYGICALF